MVFRIGSWNVLHMIHEINNVFDNSLVMEEYKITTDTKNETNRLLDIYKFVVDKLDGNNIICLQEVPGDLYNLLNTKLSDHHVINYKYPRFPKIKKPNIIDPYKINFEYLVTIIPKKICSKLIGSCVVQFDDLGKAALITNINDLIIINTHMPFGTPRTKALSNISQYLSEAKYDSYIIVGDTNMTKEEFVDELKNTSLCGYLVGFNGDTYKIKTESGILTKQIDHMLISNNIKTTNPIVEKTLMSDHNMISVDIHI